MSVQVNTTKGTYIGSGALIYQDDTGGAYILTAGHMIDFNGDGQYTTADGINSIYVFFNVPDYDSADEPRLADYLDAVQLQQSDDPAQPAAMVLALAFALGGNWQRSVLERERRAP